MKSYKVGSRIDTGLGGKKTVTKKLKGKELKLKAIVVVPRKTPRMNRTPLAEQKQQQQRRSRRKRSLRGSQNKLSLSKLNQENYDSNIYESQSSIISVSMRKGRRVPKSKSPIPRQSEAAKRKLEEELEAERLRKQEEEEAERLRLEQERQEELERRREEMLRNCEKASERIQSFIALKKLNLMTSSFNSVKCNANKIKIQETFADELLVLNLKRTFLYNLQEATHKSKFRFKLVRNFAKILRLNLRETIRAKQRGVFQRIKKIRPKPFHRTNNRVRKRKNSRTTKRLEKDKSRNCRMEKLEKMKNSALKQSKQQKNEVKMKRTKTARGNKGNTTRRASKSPIMTKEATRVTRNPKAKRNVGRSRKLDKKSKSTLELNKTSKSIRDMKESKNRSSMEKSIVFDNSKLSKSHMKNLSNSKSSQALRSEKNKTEVKPKTSHIRRKSRKIPKLEGFGSITKCKKKDRKYISEISSKAGDDFGKSFDLFEQRSDTKDSKLDIFVVSKMKKKEVAKDCERSFRRHRNREMGGDELESISVDLRKTLSLQYYLIFTSKANVQGVTAFQKNERKHR